ncbi:MAG: metal-dependent hydrolase [Myxococcales bacterium]|nr:metal-dependent hydrolase [Myxococcales bacterium]
MDNLTHILAGLVVAEVAGRVRARRAPPSAEWVRAAWFASAAAGNVPDLDFVYLGITGGKLGYLLHHRGHTHTLLVGVPLGAAVALGLVWLWHRRRRLGFDRADWAWLAALAFTGPVLHLLMDFANVYGVHPFWPFDDRWFYGDRVFIVEPLFWAAALPALFWATTARAGKTALALWLTLTAVLPVVTRMVPLAVCVAIALWVVAGLVLLARASPLRRAGAAVVGCLLVLGVFALGKPAAEAKVRAALGAAYPEETVHDVILSSNPANPACWQFVSVHTAATGSYSVRRGRASLVPALIGAQACALPTGAPTAPMRPIAAAGTDADFFDREFSSTVAELEALARESCEVAAYLRFARAPFWVERPGLGLVLGDVRFDREPGLGFAEITAERAPRQCPRFVPPWQPPRADVLAHRSSVVTTAK